MKRGATTWTSNHTTLAFSEALRGSQEEHYCQVDGNYCAVCYQLGNHQHKTGTNKRESVENTSPSSNGRPENSVLGHPVDNSATKQAQNTLYKARTGPGQCGFSAFLLTGET